MHPIALSAKVTIDMPSMTLQQAMELAVQHHRNGNLAEAEAIYRQVLSISPNQPDVLHLMGILAIQAGKLEIAADVIRRAITLNPTEPTYHANLGEALMRGGKLDEAIESFRQSIELGPVYEAWNNLGNALGRRGDLDEAIAAFHSAIALDPRLPEAHSNLGDALKQQGKLTEAMEAIDKALAIHPGLMAAHNNRGICLRALGRYDDAVESYRHALNLSPALSILHYNLAATLLLKGDYEQGFIEYEHRFGVPEMAGPLTRYSLPQWEGEELGGRSIVLHAEQGFGDTIQFVRFAPQVKSRGGRIVLAVQPELMRLMEGIEGIDEIIPLTDTPAADLHCPLLSLPRILGTTLHTIPPAPYLQVDESAVDRWKERIKPASGVRKIGVAWSGRAQFKDDHWRSLTLDALAPLAQVQNVTFYSLQVGPATSQLQSPPPGLRLIDLSPHLTDFAETAAALMNLDLLITTDTAIAHLAGAIGMPVWMLTSFSPDWRWQIDRDDSPWYPTMRLFRQTTLDDWKTPVSAIVEALAE